MGTGWSQAVGLTFTADGRCSSGRRPAACGACRQRSEGGDPVIDISEEVGDWRDYGMLGFALDPNFATNGLIYLLYVVDYHHLR